MTTAHTPSEDRRNRTGKVRPIQVEARSEQLRTGSGSSWHVGRVGALAVALGVGAAVAGMPAIAFADTTGSAGSTGSTEVGSADTE